MNLSKAEFFDSQVEADWARGDYGPEEIGKIDRMLRVADVTAGMRIIEPGCGNGRLTRILAERVGSSGHVLAMDISPKMVEVCRTRMVDFPNVEIRHSAVEDLAPGNDPFDLVVCHNVFPHFDDKPLVVAHLASALRPGGRFVVFHFMNSAGINDLHRKAHPSVLKDLIPSEKEMRDLFGAAGLQIELLRDDESGYLMSAQQRKNGV